MDFRSTPCVFLGYNTTHDGYHCYDPQSDRIYMARHVRFNEQSFPFQTPPTPNPTPTPSNPYVSTYPNSDLPPIDPPSTEPNIHPNPLEPTVRIMCKTSISQQASTKHFSLVKFTMLGIVAYKRAADNKNSTPKRGSNPKRCRYKQKGVFDDLPLCDCFSGKLAGVTPLLAPREKVARPPPRITPKNERDSLPGGKTAPVEREKGEKVFWVVGFKTEFNQ
ncbi:hypothetical protein OSB04_031679 [Centaurea solstitialis]|uniref:Retroviral polymerase SH3-like domain-containing protein n=1 Tax=Centaurea solstitialis TaxID=347529 RepID=A0AA38SM52_9ASTR|nr:hypothetical protein OSB04_031679 [Centaurea solstitialis]